MKFITKQPAANEIWLLIEVESRFKLAISCNDRFWIVVPTWLGKENAQSNSAHIPTGNLLQGWRFNCRRFFVISTVLIFVKNRHHIGPWIEYWQRTTIERNCAEIQLTVSIAVGVLISIVRRLKAEDRVLAKTAMWYTLTPFNSKTEFVSATETN